MNRLLGLLCAALLAFTPTFAAASMTTTGAGKPAVGGGGGSYTGPGDIVTGAKMWWGMRAYSAATAAAQAASIRLVRSSDSHQCDIDVTTAGGLSTVVANCSTGGDNGSTASTWCANGAGSCTVNKWYDQTGNGNDALALTAPAFSFSCLSSFACPTFGGTQGLEAFSSATAQPIFMSAVAVRTSGTGQADIVSNAIGFFFNSGGNLVGGYFGTTVSVTATDGNWHALQFLANTAGTGATNVDGADASASFGSGTPQAADVYVGQQAGTSFLTGKILEAGQWPSTTTSGQRASLCANQNTYYSLGLSC